jgi:DDE superfamily endonuclease
MSSSKNNATPLFDLDSLITKNTNTLEAIMDYEGPLLQLLDDEPVKGCLWDHFKDNSKIQTLTNFSAAVILNLYQAMAPFIVQAGRRGPKPKSTMMDSFLCYLIWATTAAHMDKLATLLGMKTNRFEDNIGRIRPILNTFLKSKWWDPRKRPTPSNHPLFPHAALLIDVHTTEAFRPKAPFEEAKFYWDGKNKIYGIKNEVAVGVNEPHYCMFVSPHTVGSTHDYQYHKKIYANYLPYLLKQPDEHEHLPGDGRYRYWAVIADMGYIGPAADTPDERRIIPKKGGNLTAHELKVSHDIKLARVPVEQFFGRGWNLWGILRGVYRWDHKHFDLDYENMCLLTNEHIHDNVLSEIDHKFYRNFISLRIQGQKDREEKRNVSEKKSKEKKAKKLKSVVSVLDAAV